MSTHNNVEVFLGKHIDVPSEQQFLARLQRDLQTLGVSARILANLQIGRLGDRQVDFVVVTDHRTMVIELKIYPGRIVSGPRNGPWTIQIGAGMVEQRGNPLQQVLGAAQHFSDELHDFARTADVPGPSRANGPKGAKFYSDLDAAACVFPVVPERSEWEEIKHTTLLGYDELLARLQTHGPSLQWSADHWDRLVRHLNLYRADEDAPENIVRRTGAAVIDGYTGLYREAKQDIGPIARTAVRVNGEPEERPNVTSLVTNGSTVLLRGASGTGKTLWAEDVAIDLAAAGQLPIWIHADMCDGTFLTACAQAIAPYTALNVNELLKAADVGGRAVVFIIDDLGKISGEGRRRLIEGLRTIRVRSAGRGLLITDQQPEHAGELGDHTDVELLLPDDDDRRAVLAVYGQAELIDRCEAFSTPFDLSIAAKCAEELGPYATRAELLDTYVDQRLGGDAVSRGALRQIASHMFSELRPFVRRGEVTQRLRRQMKLADEQIQKLYDCDLLVLSRGRIAFRHEQFEQFLAVEALLSEVEDVAEVSRRLNSPRATGLRRDAIAQEGDRDRLEILLSLCEDTGVLVDAALGLLGPDAAEAVDSVFAEVLNDACARTTAPGITLRFTGDQFHGCRWQMPTRATAAQIAGLSAIGQLLQHGRLVDQIPTLIRHTDGLLARAVEEAEAQAKALVADHVFAATYAFDHPDGLPANPLVVSATDRTLSIRPDGDRMSETINQLVADAEQAGLGAIWLAAHLMHDPRVPIRADIVIRCLKAGPYHLRLFGLSVAEDRARRLTVAGRQAIIDAIESLPTDNIMLNSSITEALSALGALQPIKTADDVAAEIDAVLAMRGDPLANRMAYGIISTQFEADLLGPYYEVVSDLASEERTQLLAMALNGSDHAFMTDEWILEEIKDLGAPESRDAVIAWVERSDPKDWMSAQHGIAATVAALTLLAAAGLPVPASTHRERLPEWEAAMALMLVAAEDDVERIAAGWSRFAATHPNSVASLVINLQRVHGWNKDRSLIDRLEAAMPAEVIAALVAAVHHPERAASIVRWDHELRRDVLKALGRFGDRSVVGALRRFADDPEIGQDAVEAVRAIEGRCA